MKSKKLDQLVNVLQEKYIEAKDDAEMSGMFSMGARQEKVVLCEYLLDAINNIYGTKYKFVEEQKYG